MLKRKFHSSVVISLSVLVSIFSISGISYAQSEALDANNMRNLEEQLIQEEEQALFDSLNEETSYLFRSCNPEPAILWAQMNSLQRHVAFFDWNGDGFITMRETYRGLRALGLNPAVSATAAVAINGLLGTPTALYPSFKVSIARIANGIHGSDTRIYDSDGNLVEENFERLFSRWDRNGDDALDLKELTRRTLGDSDLFDFFGVIASAGEFGLLFAVAAEDGKLSRERMRQFYDGSLFYLLAAERGTLGCRRFGP